MGNNNTEFCDSCCLQAKSLECARWKLLSNEKKLPFISRIALVKSFGSLKLTKPNPFVLFVRLSRITFAFWNDGYLLKARANVSSVTSLPRSPQNNRKSSTTRKKRQRFSTWRHTCRLSSVVRYTDDVQPRQQPSLHSQTLACSHTQPCMNYYSFTNPGGMEGWVGWHTVDSLPTEWSL